MFSKGTKRKFSEGVEDGLSEVGVRGGGDDGGLSGGSGGELSPSSSSSSSSSVASYSLQRQSLLDMSLIKLQLCHMLVEPNLCRSVLIANTVRQIQEEMTHDGSWHTAAMMEAFAASGGAGGSGSGTGPSERLVATEVLCRPGREMNGGLDAEPKLFSVMGYEGCREEEVVAVEEEEEEEEEEDVEEEDVEEEEDEAICSEVASNVCLSGSMGHCWKRGGVLRGKAELGDTRLCSTDEDVDVEEEEEEEEEDHELHRGGRQDGQAKAGAGTRQLFGTFEIKNGHHPGSESALEELFSDVDASYYDLDTMLTGMQAAPKIGPYDLLDSLSQSHAPSSLPSPANCRSDLNELDHIMEIIVGS